MVWILAFNIYIALWTKATETSKREMFERALPRIFPTDSTPTFRKSAAQHSRRAPVGLLPRSDRGHSHGNRLPELDEGGREIRDLLRPDHLGALFEGGRVV